ncbi:Protein kinase C theta type [Taenia solium]|eukprot:TsM_000351200 transcript=TsM_000351200 gene=TsM_000351200
MVADEGSFADLPPVHPASSSLGSGGGTFGLATISNASGMTSTHLTRSRGSMSAADRPHSSALSNHHRRPLSLAEASVTSSSSITTNTTKNVSRNIFPTLSTPKKNKQKISAPYRCLDEKKSPFLKKSGERHEGLEESKCSIIGAQHNFATATAQNAATSLPSDHFLGRVLNEEDNDDEKIQETICALASRFQSAFSVLNSPSLSAILLNYLLVQNHELAPTLFYLVAKHYHWMQTHCKEVAKDHQRVLMEIYTTFLHEKSPLCVKVDSQLIQQMEDSITSNETATIFESCCTVVLPQIQVQVDKLTKDIRHGLDTWKPSESFDLNAARSGEEELSIYEGILTPRVNELQRIIAGQTLLQTGSQLSTTSPFIIATSAVVTWVSSTAMATETPREQIASALCASLVSAYRYFAASTAAATSSPPIQSDAPTEASVIDLGPTCPNTPTPPQHSFRKNFFAKSIENLTAASIQVSSGTSLGSTNLSGSLSSGLATIGAINWNKLPSFNAKLKSKSSNTIFGSWKTRHPQKGHSLQERIFDRTTECAVCGGLIWGLAPQGLSCQACDVSVHHRCRVGLRESCAKDNRSSVASRCSIFNVGPSTSSGISSIATASSSPCSGILNSGAYPPELANVSEGKSTSSLEDTGGSSGGREDSGCSSSLATSKEDMFHCRSSSFNELINKSPSYSPLQNPCISPPDRVVSFAVDGEVRVKRSNSGLSHACRGSSQAGPTSPEPISRYVRNVKQKLDNHSYGGMGTALLKHTTSLMHLPVMADRDLKRPIGSQNSSSSALVSAAANVPELLPTWTGDPEMDVSESFEAATELRIHFPNYEIPTKGPRIQDHVRTLVLLEFHQKVRYMVCYLKQFEYLLLRRWPREHQHLADLMALDRIPRLIRLFRSLVHAIEHTVEPQGYGKMAEAVLTWLSKDDEANLKAWVRDCQALSCTNMLDSVKAMVREYARKHPDIQVVLETRFNKFVLIESLSQVRILYFNLPLISSNIMKDLERKTSNYKAEAKIWKEIHSKLASIPHSIDKICMPLVKLINDGHFFSTVDKGDQLTRHQAQGGYLPFADLLLHFPRTLFRFWVIDHAGIAVDKLTFTSDNKVNYDYVKERTEVLAVLLNSVLMLLVKDGGRYGLRPFKPSKEPGMENLPTSTSNTASLSSTQFVVAPNLLGNTMKLLPIFSTDSVFASLGEQIGQEYMLNMIFKKQAMLLRLSFTSKETREKWLNILKRREQISVQQRLTVQKPRGSLPPVSMRSGDQKVGSEYLETIRASVRTVQPSANFGNLAQIVDPELLLPISSSEPLEKQVTRLSEKISEVEQDLQTLIQSISNSQSSNANKFLEKLSLGSGDTVSQTKRELIILELLLTENWLKFVTKHLHQLSRSPKWFGEKRASATAVATTPNSELTTASERGHQRSKSAVVVPTGLRNHRRRSRNGSGSIYRDFLEQTLSKTSLSGSKEVTLIEGRKIGGDGGNQLLDIIHDLQKLVESTSLAASRALGNLERQERVEWDSKSDDDHFEAFLDANSSLLSSHSSLSTKEIDKSLIKDCKNVQETGLEGILFSDYEAEEEDRKSNGVGGQELLERVGHAEMPSTGHVTGLKEDSKISHPLVAKEEDGTENVDEPYEDEVQMVALQLVDGVIEYAGSHEMDLAMSASDLTASVVASAITQVMGDRYGDSELACAKDSNSSFLEIVDHLSSGEDDAITVTGSKPHLAPTPTETDGPTIPFSDLDKLNPAKPSSSIGVSVGGNDSQKSTTSSGYLVSGDKFVQHDWI